MKSLISLACLLFIVGTACAASDEIKIQRRIALANSLDTGSGIRLMLHTSAFSLLPQSNVTGYYGPPPPAPPGTSAGVATMGNVLGILLVKGIQESQEQGMRDFRGRLEDALASFNIEQELYAEVMAALNWTQSRNVAVEHVTEPANLEQPGLLLRIEEK